MISSPSSSDSEDDKPLAAPPAMPTLQSAFSTPDHLSSPQFTLVSALLLQNCARTELRRRHRRVRARTKRRSRGRRRRRKRRGKRRFECLLTCAGLIIFECDFEKKMCFSGSSEGEGTRRAEEGREGEGATR